MNVTETLSKLSDVMSTAMSSLDPMTSLNASLVPDNQTGTVEPEEEDPYAYYKSDEFWEKASVKKNLN